MSDVGIPARSVSHQAVPRQAGSLRGRLLRRLGVLLAILMLICGWSAYWNGRGVADTAYDRTLLSSARAIAAGLHAQDGSLNADVPYVALDEFAYDSSGHIFYQVLDTQGKLISGYEALPPPPPGTPRTDDYPALARFYNGTYRNMPVRVISLLQPVSQPSLEGMAEIRVAETLYAREQMARGLLLDTLWRLGLIALGALLLTWFAVSAALRPLERLRVAVEDRQPDDLRPLPLVTTQRELKPLVRALNHFTERLREQFVRQEQFIADASHELRTPLAALKARLELGLRDTEPARWRATLEDSARSTDRLTHLANQLLSLARIERGARAIAEGGAETLDLSQLTRELALALAPLAHKRGLDLALEAERSVWVTGEPTLLNELLNNLVENAMAHAEHGGHIVLRVMAPGTLEVEDDGPGIAAPERERVFERFYRSRPQGSGAGLGLAIVGEICRAHQARISLHDGTKGGLRVRVEFGERGA